MPFGAFMQQTQDNSPWACPSSHICWVPQDHTKGPEVQPKWILAKLSLRRGPAPLFQLSDQDHSTHWSSHPPSGQPLLGWATYSMTLMSTPSWSSSFRAALEVALDWTSDQAQCFLGIKKVLKFNRNQDSNSCLALSTTSSNWIIQFYSLCLKLYYWSTHDTLEQQFRIPSLFLHYTH